MRDEVGSLYIAKSSEIVVWAIYCGKSFCNSISSQSRSVLLISISSSVIGIPFLYLSWVFCIVFWMMPAIFLVAYASTSFIFWVIGCASPRYLDADWAALAYEFRDAWYCLRNSCSTAMLWYAIQSTISLSSGFFDCVVPIPVVLAWDPSMLASPAAGTLEINSS